MAIGSRDNKDVRKLRAKRSQASKKCKIASLSIDLMN
jgi:hypothetical protein